MTDAMRIPTDDLLSIAMRALVLCWILLTTFHFSSEFALEPFRSDLASKFVT